MSMNSLVNRYKQQSEAKAEKVWKLKEESRSRERMKEEIKGIKNKDLDDFFDDDESDENIDLTNQKSEIS